MELKDEDAFSPEGTRITFDPQEGRAVNEVVSTQYQALGVAFLDDASTTPLIVDDAIRGATTHSDGQSLSNDADTVQPGSAGVPLTILFQAPVRRVGMYIGNGSAGTQATLSAFDVTAPLIFSATNSSFGDAVETFIGIDAGSAIIGEVRLDYGNTLASEEIDDLMFE